MKRTKAIRAASGNSSKPCEPVCGPVIPSSEIAVVRRAGAEEVDLSYAAVNETEAAAMALTPGQRKAIERLTSGSTAVEAASAAGVGRSTLYRWLKDDPVFVAAYNSWQRDMLATARGKMLALTDLALVALGKSLSRGDGKLALRLLERMGIAERPTEGETDVQEIQRQQELAARKADVERRKKAVDTVIAEEEVFVREALNPPMGDRKGAALRER